MIKNHSAPSDAIQDDTSGLGASLRKAAMLVTLGAATLGGAKEAQAVLEKDGVPDINYRNRGDTMHTAGQVLSLMQMGPAGERGYASLTPWNSEYGITSGHLTKVPLAAGYTFAVGFDNNYHNGPSNLTDPGTQWMGISNVLVYPGYDGTPNTPDIAIVRYAQPLGTPQQIVGSATSGSIVSAAGYGFAFHPSDPIPSTRDGYVRGWDGYVSPLAPGGGYSDTYYDATLFGFPAASLDGKNLNGDSGGPVYNSLGELIGLNTAQTGNNAIAGDSIYLNLSQPDVYNWINANTQVTPEPTALAVMGFAAVGVLGSRRRRS